jgi:hypothetical protein
MSKPLFPLAGMAIGGKMHAAEMTEAPAPR